MYLVRTLSIYQPVLLMSTLMHRVLNMCNSDCDFKGSMIGLPSIIFVPHFLLLQFCVFVTVFGL